MEIKLYDVVQIFRNSGRRRTIEKNLTQAEAARLVNSFPNSDRSMVVFFKQRG